MNTDIQFTNETLRSFLESGINVLFPVSGIPTSLRELTMAGYWITVRRMDKHTPYTKLHFCNGTSNITLKIKNMPHVSTLEDLVSVLPNLLYTDDVTSQLNVQYVTEHLHNPTTFCDLSDAELLAELERRVDCLPKRRKKPTKDSNVIDFIAVLERLKEHPSTPLNNAHHRRDM